MLIGDATTRFLPQFHPYSLSLPFSPAPSPSLIQFCCCDAPHVTTSLLPPRTHTLTHSLSLFAGGSCCLRPPGCEQPAACGPGRAWPLLPAVRRPFVSVAILCLFLLISSLLLYCFVCSATVHFACVFHVLHAAPKALRYSLPTYNL